MPPIGVVVPRHVDELVEIHRVCREHDAPIVLRGGGTSLAGQGCNTAVLIDCSKYLRGVLELDPDRRIARVQPGCILDDLRAAAGEHGLTFGPDPSTHAYCTLGGMLGNNSCGRHSIQAEFHGPGPRVADNVVGLEVLTYRGERLRIGRGGAGVPDAIAGRLRALADANADEIRGRYPQIPRRVSGYNLDELLPENGLRGRALARRHRVDVRDDPRGDARAGPETVLRLAPRGRLPGQVPHRRPRAARARTPADLDRGHGPEADRRHDAARHPPVRALRVARRRGAGCWSSSAARRRRSRMRRRAPSCETSSRTDGRRPH